MNLDRQAFRERDLLAVVPGRAMPVPMAPPNSAPSTVPLPSLPTTRPSTAPPSRDTEVIACYRLRALPCTAFDSCVASSLTCKLEIIRLNVSFKRS